jgi:hypothetical protein
MGYRTSRSNKGKKKSTTTTKKSTNTSTKKSTNTSTKKSTNTSTGTSTNTGGGNRVHKTAPTIGPQTVTTPNPSVKYNTQYGNVSLNQMGVNVTGNTVKTKYDQSKGFETSTGSDMYIRGQDGQIDPRSKEGQTIKAILESQRQRKIINAERQKLTEALRNAKTSGEALAISAQAREQNPNVMIRQEAWRDGKLVEVMPKGDYSGDVRNLDYSKRDPITGQFKDVTPVIRQGQDSVRITGASKDSQWQFLNKESSNVITSDIGQANTMTQLGILPGTQTPSNKIDYEGYLKDDEKAFDWYLDVPTDNEAGSGFVKGTSNLGASVWNIGSMFQEYALGRKDVDYAGYYPTPITTAEQGVMSGAIETVYSDNTWQFKPEKFGSNVATGFQQSGQLIQDRPIESLVSGTIEAVPYFIGGGFKSAFKFIGNFGSNIAGTSTKTIGKTIDNFTGTSGPKSALSKAEAGKQSGIFASKGTPTKTQLDNYYSLIGKKDVPTIKISNIVQSTPKKTKPDVTWGSSKRHPDNIVKVPDSIKTPKNVVKGFDNVLVPKKPTKGLVPKKPTKGLVPKKTGPIKPGKFEITPIKPGKVKPPGGKPGWPVRSKKVDTPVKPPGKGFGFLLPGWVDLGGGGGFASMYGASKPKGKKSFVAWNVSTDSISVKGDQYVRGDTADILNYEFKEKKRKKDLFKIL